MSEFDKWFHEYTQCPRCRLSDNVRLAASNAWHIQQSKYDRLEKAALFLRNQIENCASIHSDTMGLSYGDILDEIENFDKTIKGGCE